MKSYQTPYMKFFIAREDAICASSDGDVDMSKLFGPIFGDDTGTGGND